MDQRISLNRPQDNYFAPYAVIKPDGKLFFPRPKPGHQTACLKRIRGTDSRGFPKYVIEEGHRLRGYVLAEDAYAEDGNAEGYAALVSYMAAAFPKPGTPKTADVSFPDGYDRGQNGRGKYTASKDLRPSVCRKRETQGGVGVDRWTPPK